MCIKKCVHAIRTDGKKLLLPALFALSVFLAALLFPASADAADADLPYAKDLNYLYKDIYVDGYHIHNWQLQNSVTVSDGSAYIPLDELFCSMLGLSMEQHAGRYELVLREPQAYPGPESPEIIANHFADRQSIRIHKDASFYLVDGFTDDAPSPEKELEAAVRSSFAGYYADLCCQYLGPAGRGFARLVLGEEPLPSRTGRLLNINANDVFDSEGVLYIRLTALTEAEELPYSVYFDSYGGLSISTDPQTTAEEQFSENNRSYIKGRVDYMRKVQKALTENDAILLEYLFRHEAAVNGISEDLIMGVARTESRYSLGYFYQVPIGLMQLMPSTVTRGGYTLTFARTVHGNIQFGAAYIARNIKVYNGETLGLTAYNQGGGAVTGGTYSLSYAEKVFGYREELQSYCTASGCSNEFLSVSENVCP
ncbi:MAG: transglycosylase SLT domain-containing protein [Firmicutes bacterium]|nr:transglycosylase SLT domain-containing protein [Bacillota bacterium]